MTDAALIVVNYGHEHLDLSYVPAGTPVIVVCNDGRRPSVETAGVVEFLEPGRNLGFGAGVNLGVDACESTRVAVVNPDCELAEQDWTHLIEGTADEVVVLPLMERDGTSTIVASEYPSLRSFLLSALRARHRLAGFGIQLGRPAQAPGHHPLTTHWFSGAAFSIDRERFLSVGGFDPAYFLYWEDADLARRLGQAHPAMAVRVADVPPAVHEVGTSAAGSSRVETERLLSAARFGSRTRGRGWRVIGRLLRRQALRRRWAPRQRPGGEQVVILTLGRESANGERRRARTWAEIAGAAGQSSRELPLALHRNPLRLATVRTLVPLARGDVVPEVLGTDPLQHWDHLRTEGASAIVCVTARAYHPRLAELGVPVILDFVDRLSDSYADRATSPALRRPTRWALRALSIAHRRFETRQHPTAYSCAAGLADATKLGVRYVPIVTASAAPAASTADSCDLVFVGTLDYPPNVESVMYLERIWPALLARRPGTTLRLAGSRPGPTVVAAARRHGWTLMPDFRCSGDAYGGALVAVAPLTMASGMQIKVQEAMAHGLPVVASGQALAGYVPNIPAVRADSERELIDGCVALLSNEAERQRLASAGLDWLEEALSPASLTWAIKDVLPSGPAPSVPT